jgi:hypothetical protein
MLRRFATVLENVVIDPVTRVPDFDDNRLAHGLSDARVGCGKRARFKTRDIERASVFRESPIESRRETF